MKRIVIAAGVVVIGAFVAVYALFFTPDSPKKLTLSKDTSQGTSSAPAGDLAGAWKVLSESEAGYRVREKLARLPAQSDAVGRTTGLTGSLTVEKSGNGLVVQTASFEADLAGLKSDEQRRDNRIRTTGIETDRFPKATFALASPAQVPQDLMSGKQVTVPVTGDLTIHGVTKRVTIPLAAAARGTAFELVGSYGFPMSDFGITPPSIQPFVSVEPNATLEFRLVLGR
jgi:polyisoprenoid-binding protein YceI